MASQYVEVLGSKMHYREEGSGRPILFLHGVPTSSHLWRNIMPHLASLGRCIAPDLIGFGKSDQPDITYSVFDHIRYIEEFIRTLDLKEITLVMHGWGALIGFDYARRHEKNCRGLVFYEAFLPPLSVDELSLPYQEQLLLLATQKNPLDIINQTISATIMRHLTANEMLHYQQPFLQTSNSQPLLQYLRELPRGDESTKVDNLIIENAKNLQKSTLPKLMLYSIPGFITTMATVMWAKDNLPNIEIIDIGEELHLAQETCPDLMGETISVWLQGVEQAHA